MDASAATAEHHVEGGRKVTPLELFFDLVFVFAFTQVTAFLAAEPTVERVVQGTMVLAALWWAWGGYAWMANAVDPDEGPLRLWFFLVMGVLLVVCLAVPGAFGDDAVLFAGAYLAVRVLHLFLYLGTADRELRRAIAGAAPFWLIAPALLLAVAWLDDPARLWVWAFALLIDYGGALAGGEGWSLDAAHFAERHALIFLIALGESIVAIGIGAGAPEPDVLLPAALGMVITTTLWWTYFDVVAIVAERKLVEAEGANRARQARDSYSYLHLPMVCGVILFALGVKKVLGHADEPLKAVPAGALCLGVALYFVAHILFRLRNVGTLNRPRLVTAVVLAALFAFGRELDAQLLLALVTLVCVTLVAYEAIRYREARHRIRNAE